MARSKVRGLMCLRRGRYWVVERIPSYGYALIDQSESPVAPVKAYEFPYTLLPPLRCEPAPSHQAVRVTERISVHGIEVTAAPTLTDRNGL